MASTIIKTPAKVNLYLAVLGKRHDGYHEIETVFAPVTLFDEVEVATLPEGSGVEVVCPGHPSLEGEKNICFKAAHAFFRAARLPAGIRIEIRKNIPIAAGLGGGSSDAAAVLLALDSLSGGALRNEELARIAGSLGADVPFFLDPAPAIGRGIGEKLKKIRLPEMNLLILNPGFPISTAWAYGNLMLTSAVIKDINSCFFEDLGSVVANLRNDLEKVCERAYPRITAMKELLKKAGASGSLMSGSGPSVFGVFENASLAGAACTAIPAAGSFKAFHVSVLAAGGGGAR